MADETNLSSKLPVADRTREVWGRKLCWWLSAEYVSARFRWIFLLRIHQHPFLRELTTLLDPVQSVSPTLLVSWSPLGKLWVCPCIASFDHSVFRRSSPKRIFFGDQLNTTLATSCVYWRFIKMKMTKLPTDLICNSSSLDRTIE